jgi:hypothetical protein
LQPEELVLQSVYYGMVLIVVVYLTVLAQRTRNYVVLLLAGAFLMKLLVQLIKPLEFENVLRALLDFNDIPLILLYTKLTYHQRQKGHFLAMITTVMILRVIVGILVFAFLFDIPTTRNLAGLDLAVYYLYIACGAALTWIANGYIVYSAATVIMKRRDEDALPALFKMRNQWILLGFAPFLIVPFAWFSLPTDGSAYGKGGTWSSVASIALACAIFFWFVLSRISHRMKLARESEKRLFKELSTHEGTEITEKILNQYGVMAVVNYLGEALSKAISRPPNAAKGLILLAIQSQLGDEAVYRIKLNQMLDVIGLTLKMRLEVMGITNVTEIVKLLSAKLVDKQALLTMLSPND